MGKGKDNGKGQRQTGKGNRKKRKGKGKRAKGVILGFFCWAPGFPNRPGKKILSDVAGPTCENLPAHGDHVYNGKFT